MNTRLFATMFLSATLSLPLVAQQTAPADQSATSPKPTATGKDKLQPGGHDFWDGDEPGLGALVLHPFASKKYVQRHLQSIQDRVNELNELTESNSKMIKDVDARAQQGIQLASAKTNLADEHARDAADKAQLANQSATAVNTRLTTVEASVNGIDQYKSATQTEIRFRPGQTVLSKSAKDALDELATQLKDKRGYLVEVQGFAPGVGQAAIANSRKMADSVVRYLVLNHEIPSYRIFVIGMGNAAVANRGTGSRVEVSLLKNDTEQAAK